MKSKSLELLVGLFMAIGLAALFFLAMKVSNLSSLGQSDGYQVTARFDNIGGLKVRSPVMVSGVRVGQVTDIEYDNERYEAVVSLELDGEYRQFPDDTAVSIFTAGLLGEQYVALEPGGSEEYWEEGAEAELTQSAIILEQLISKFLFSKASDTIEE
ncbi:MAG: outer membrane lipid asymmetry maintenance protein MlaD [Gammaproteobacteria bacterium]